MTLNCRPANKQERQRQVAQWAEVTAAYDRGLERGVADKVEQGVANEQGAANEHGAENEHGAAGEHREADERGEADEHEQGGKCRELIKKACPTAIWMAYPPRLPRTRAREGLFDQHNTTGRLSRSDIVPHIFQETRTNRPRPSTFIKTKLLFQMVNTLDTTIFSCRAEQGFASVRVSTAKSTEVARILQKQCGGRYILQRTKDDTLFAYPLTAHCLAAHFILPEALESATGNGGHGNQLTGTVELVTSTCNGALCCELTLSARPSAVAFALGRAHGAGDDCVELFKKKR